MSEDGLGLFEGKTRPNHEIGWKLYDRGVQFNNQIQLSENVKANENFYIGKQWEGVESNGLPTPQINFMKRVVGFIVATITSDNIRVTASPMANVVGGKRYSDIVEIVNHEFEALVERNSVAFLVREYARNAAVDGDGCMYTYWDPDLETGQTAKGGIVTEIVENTRVFFGNENDRRVQTQPWIILAKREPVRTVKRRAKANGVSSWKNIRTDDEAMEHVDSAKATDDNCTVCSLFWRDDDTGTIWCYEYTMDSTVREPWDMKIKLYPFNWLNWDYIQDCYHGQAMISGLIPNQVFVNKAWAMTMLSIMRAAFGKVVFDNTRIRKWDNRVGGCIGVPGPIQNVAQIIDPPALPPQVSQYIQLAVEQTEQSLGATAVALGDTRPDNTSAIIALQRAAATPSEMTKQNLYKSMEDLFRIYLDFMGQYYGKRYVEAPPTMQEQNAVAFAQEMNPDIEMPDTVPVLFDFKILKEHPVTIRLDVGGSAYYSEIAATQTLDNLLAQGHITIVDYLERIPDSSIPGRRALLEEKRRELGMQQQMMAGPEAGPAPSPEEGPIMDLGQKMDVHGGRGYGSLQRKINEAGSTAGLV